MCMKKIVIIGNGGFAKEIKWLIERINAKKKEWDFLGFIDEKSNIEDRGVIGNDSYVMNVTEELYVAIAIGNSRIRNEIYEKYKHNSNIRFPNLIDPSVLMSSKVRLGKGNIICAGTVFTVDICVEDFNIINLDCTIGHGTEIGNYVTINPGSNISGDVKIANMTEIGTGVQIIQGKTIGEKVILGAGAVVVNDIPAGCTAVGVPAKIIKRC